MYDTLQIIKQKVADQFTKVSGSYLLAFSGGLDSVVLANLLLQLEIPFEIAHYNYQLRGEESEENRRFCIDFANRHDLVLHIHDVDASEKEFLSNGNLQAAARDLRYKWLFERMTANNLEAVLTAHHADDQVETVLLHQFRGTGLSGLKGMASQSGMLKRPLLGVFKSELLLIAQSQNWSWSEDSSNYKDKYQRNFIRNQLVETIEARFTNVRKTMLNNIRIWTDEFELLQFFIADFLKEKLVSTAEGEVLNWRDLQSMPSKRSILHFWLGPFGFNETNYQMLERIYNPYDGERLIQLGDAQLHLLRDRLVLVLSTKKKNSAFFSQRIRIENGQQYKLANDNSVYSIKIYQGDSANSNGFVVYLPSEFEGETILVRRWEVGDKIRISGLNGSKKLSDLFTAYKLDKSAKNKALVLELQGKVIAVWPYRIAEGCDKKEKGQLHLEIDLL